VVCRVLPGMQAAFVEIGLERAAFLHISGLCSKELEQKGSENIEHYLIENLSHVKYVRLKVNQNESVPEARLRGFFPG
jgi:Ribonuclease G/E